MSNARFVRRSRTASFVGALALAACASKPPPPPVIETQEAELGQTSATEPSPVPSDVPVAEGSGPTPVPGGEAPPAAVGETAATGDVTLLEPGSAPRRELRHVFKKGASQRLSMKAKTRVKGASMPLPTITLDAPMESRIVELNPAGEARFQFKAGPFKTGMGGGGGMGAGLGGMLGGAVGASAPEKVSGWGWITARGVVREFHVEEGASDGDAPVEKGDPFPEQAVGVGARWEVRSTFEEKGVLVQQTSTYELVKLEAKAVYTNVSRVQVPVGSTDGSKAGSAKSSGQLVFRLGDVYPTGRLSMTRALEFDLTGLGGGAPLVMASEVTIAKR